MGRFEGKSVIITGASRGIGAATAHAFAREGAAVVLAARSEGQIAGHAETIRKAGGKAAAIATDVSSWEAVEAMVARCTELFGGPDILVNNAGVIEPIGPLASVDPAAWTHATDINFKGVFHGIRAAIPRMIRAGSGVIVNISSGAANNSLEGWSHYCSAKAAAKMLTACANREAPAGVRVIGLSPGTVATDMQVAIKASGINPVSQLDPSVHIPAEWPAEAILWLCTDDAKEFDGTDVSLRDEDIRARIGLT